jgi:hypothetical protein
MKQNNAEILKTNKAEGVDLKEFLSEARHEVADETQEAREAEEQAQSLKLELMQAQAARESKDEAERKGKETSEKIAEVTG